MKCYLFILCTFFFQIVHSQQLNFRSFSFEQGLNTYNIQKVVQDKYGYLWIATQDGLYRYNAKTFEAFRKQGGETGSIRENFIFDIRYDGNDLVYIASFNGGVDVVNVRTLAVLPLLNEKTDTSDGLPNLWIQKLHSDVNDNLWIGGKDYLSIYQAKQKKFSHLLKIEGFSGSVNVSFIKSIDSTTIAVGVMNYGILLYDVQSLKQVALIENLIPLKNTVFQATDLLKLGPDIFLSSGPGLITGTIRNRQWQFNEAFHFPALGGSRINCIVADKKNIWMGSNSGLGRLHRETKQFTITPAEVNKKRTLQANSINHLAIDNQENLWISSSKVLQMVDLRPSPFTHYSGDEEGNTKMDHIYSIIPKSAAEVFCTGTDGLYITNLENRMVKKVEGSGSLGTVHYTKEIKPGLWFVSSDEGNFAYSLSKQILSQELLLTEFPEWKPHARKYFNTSLQKGDRIFWASEEQEGLFIWNTRLRTITNLKANTPGAKGLPENHIHNIKEDRNGNLWLLFDKSVAKYDPSIDSVTLVIPYSPGTATFNSGIFFDLYDDGETLWFGTFSGGLNGYNKRNGSWSYITEKDGLCNNCVYGILPEKDSVFWVSTNRGLSRVNYITKKCSNYFFEDGLQDNSFDEKGALKFGNKLLFGGINGFTALDLSNYYLNENPFKVYIDRVEYLHKNKRHVLNNLQWNSLDLPPGTTSVTIHLSALSFSKKLESFSYRIKDFQEDFVEVSDDNKIVLNALGYGDYLVEIAYRNENGELVTGPLNLDVHIKSKWYQTWWFRLFIFLAAISVVYIFFLIRLGQLKKEKQIRSRLATDLHDDLGSTLNSVKVYTNLALMEKEREGHLHKIKESTQEAITGVRDIIWVLDDKKDTIEHLISRIEQFAVPLSEANGVLYKKHISEEAKEFRLAQEEKRNLYMIIKESINNITKYAGAGEYQVLVHINKGKPAIIIKDNGRGFDTDTTPAGNGLKNMRYRAAQIKYNIRIDSKPGAGTAIKLQKA